MRDDLYRALDQCLQDLRCVHWGRGYQLASEEDRLRCIEHVMSLIEPALEMAGLDIKPKTLADKVFGPAEAKAYVWQFDRSRNDENTVLSTSANGATVESSNESKAESEGDSQLFYNGLC